MSYIDGNLMNGEKVVYRTHLHPVIFLKAALLLVLALLFFLAGAFVKVPATGKTLTGFGAILFLIGIILGIAAYIRRTTSEFGVTNKRVVIKVGFIRRTSIETLLTRVEGINVEQGILGRILGYGSIDVRGVGGGNNPFHHIHDPLAFRRKVQEQTSEAEMFRSAGTPTATGK